ncbi:Zinc resistance conferring protein [Marasmius tenuissimus]|nr:Zinc resistance conferring protein [Marasmius tenuissimus]
MSSPRASSDSFKSLYGHPAATRAYFVQTAHELATATSPPTSPVHSRHTSNVHLPDEDPVTANTEIDSGANVETAPLLDNEEEERTLSPDPGSPVSHSHSHSHSGSMNMRGILLHVLGDALGNIGVIGTGLIIWLSSWSFKHYFDPAISLVITCIIFSSALPLVRSASFILLQAVPATVSLDDVRRSILDVEGVLSLHELHIWQLSETKIVASVHVMASRKHDFMAVAAKIRHTLHLHGVHSSTIQPEYARTSRPDEHLMTTEESGCLLPCPADQSCNPQENACCPPPLTGNV